MYEVIDLNQFNKEKDLEICALKIKFMLTYLSNNAMHIQIPIRKHLLFYNSN